MEFRHKGIRVGCYHQEVGIGRFNGSAYVYLYGDQAEPMPMVHVARDAASGKQALSEAREAAIFFLDEIAGL
ncbi:hypothetical protein CEK28_05905 [Xenophilus sp. AP218F]|nr:hypothetical protein [Chromobacterium sp. ASV5]OWY40257.1 hypothetical protein CEK28_05905 [Xenophilus sp. AP218F]